MSFFSSVLTNRNDTDWSMINITDYIQTFTNLPPFTNNDDIDDIEDSVIETFAQLEIEHTPYFCCQSILHELNKEWDRMLYICDDGNPVIAFYSADSQGHQIFVDIYGNLFENELKLMQSINCTKYYKYYNAKKVFTVAPMESDEEYLKELVKNFEMLGCLRIAKMMEKFIESIGPETTVRVLKNIKNVYRLFMQLTRNFDRITELKMGNSPEILIIKLFEEKRKTETIIELNLEKLSNEAGYMCYAKLMWRINVENRDDQAIKEEAIPETIPQSTFFNSTENYLITVNRYFLDNESYLTKCNALAERISEELFLRRLTHKRATLSQFKNIVLWLRERLTDEYETEEEVLQEYYYLFNQVNMFNFKNFKYIHIHSAVVHIYKHFDSMINKECFANYKRTLDLKVFNDSENIIGKLIKTTNHTKLLKDCFAFFFNFIPSKLFKKENFVYRQITGIYQAFNYTTDEICGSQIKFDTHFNSPLSIATMYAFDSQGDVNFGDGKAIDFQSNEE